jgi:hypothetical protein
MARRGDGVHLRRRMWRAVLLIATLIALPSGAWAECAWVLWTSAGSQAPRPGQAVVAAFSRVEDCHTALAAVIEGMKQKHGTETGHLEPKGWGRGSYDDPTRGNVVLNCLPDTVDPRAPTGGKP